MVTPYLPSPSVWGPMDRGDNMSAYPLRGRGGAMDRRSMSA